MRCRPSLRSWHRNSPAAPSGGTPSVAMSRAIATKLWPPPGRSSIMPPTLFASMDDVQCLLSSVLLGMCVRTVTTHRHRLGHPGAGLLRRPSHAPRPVEHPSRSGRRRRAAAITGCRDHHRPGHRRRGRIPALHTLTSGPPTSRSGATGGTGQSAAPGAGLGLRWVVRGGSLGGVDQLGGHDPEFDVAPLGDRPQGCEGVLGAAPPVGHHDPDRLVDDRAGGQRDSQVIRQGDLVVVPQRARQVNFLVTGLPPER
jgi:hypothetical protein